MAAVEVIYLLAAILWIGVVSAALCLGLRLVVKLRAKRRRVNRILGVVRIPLLLCTLPWPGPSSDMRGNVNQLLSAVLADALGRPRENIGRRPRRAPRGRRRSS